MSGREIRIRTRDQVLVDELRDSPVDVRLARTRRRGCGCLLLILVLLAAWLGWRFTRDAPVDYAAVDEHFKYGSIGAEPGGSLLRTVGGTLPPYWVFKVLPDICPDMLPGGYASLGLLFEDGREMPIGVSRRYRVGTDLAGLNCAVCHTGTYRETPESEPRIVLGMPAHQFDIQAFTRFITECPLDERFTPENVLAKIERAGGDLDFLDRWIYRTQLIPRTREATMVLARRIAVLLGDRVTAWGRGRVDTFNPYKALQFNWRLDRLPREELTGASDFPSLWNQKPRDGMQLHWDGNNDSVDERNLSASLGAGVTPVTIDHERLKRVADWAWTSPPPDYPFAVDRTIASRGQALYGEHCLDCHADHTFRDGQIKGSRVGEVEPLAAIGTDRHRWASYTYKFSANQYTLYPDSDYRFNRFRKTEGYANHPLDAIWARAPYLHNGSVPTLRDLLEPPEARPRVFYRGYDVFDQEKVGFRADVASENGVDYTRYDTSLPGNSNDGHRYGLELSAEDKDALVEYMKTL